MVQLLLVALPGLLIYAAVSDLLSLTIPNSVSLALIALFAVAAAFVGLPWPEVGLHVAACALVLTLGFVCFARGWIGGGDAKLGAAIALWLGFSHLGMWLLATALIGGVLTLAIMQLRAIPVPVRLQRQQWLARLRSPANGVPYGIALSTGALLVLPHTMWFQTISP